MHIAIAQGLSVEIDDCDWPLVKGYTWWPCKGHQTYYAHTKIWIAGKRVNLQMHRLLLPGVKIVDHRDRNGLNNKRQNLRAATDSQNCANSRLPKNNTSGFKGVYPVGKRWRTCLKANGKRLCLGTHDTPEEAARAYDKAALEHFGEFAYQNFPTDAV